MIAASTTTLNCPPERAWEEVQTSRLLAYITAPPGLRKPVLPLPAAPLAPARRPQLCLRERIAMTAHPETATPGTAWNRARYSAYAPIYDLVAAPFATGRRRSIELLALQLGERVLIIGCGTGLDLPLLPANVRVTAFDLTPAMVARTAARAAELGRAVDTAVMNGQQVALADGAFDAILLHLILAVIPDPVACVKDVGGQERRATFTVTVPEQ